MSVDFVLIHEDHMPSGVWPTFTAVGEMVSDVLAPPPQLIRLCNTHEALMGNLIAVMIFFHMCTKKTIKYVINY